jgi:hypothetical protein
MKTFRLIVATRLALFPLIFNLSFAQEFEVDTENSVISNECEKSTEQIEGETLMDSSSQAPQNDEGDIQDFYPDSGNSLLSG